MKCPEVVEWMHRYLDYDLDEEETVKLYEHLKNCPECAETFRMLRSLSRDLEDLPKITPKFSLVDAIMPQLDAIDQARQEKSASLEEVPAEMVPVPSRPVRNSKFRNSIAGRTVVGAVAAALILGVAIYGYSPKQLSTADEQLTKESTASSAYESGANAPVPATEGTQESSGSELKREELPNVEPKEDAGSKDRENTDSGKSSDSGDPNTPSTRSTDTSGEEGTAKQDPAAKSSPQESSSADKADSSNKVNQDTVTQQQTDDTEAFSDSAKTDSGPPASDSGKSGTVTGNADSQNNDNTDQQDDKGSQINEDNSKMDIMSIAPNEKLVQLSSPDGKYAAAVEDKKLVIYSISDDGSANKAVRTIDLPGSWVSGVWSADSTVLTYQTSDANGSTTSQTYQVNSSANQTP